MFFDFFSLFLKSFKVGKMIGKLDKAVFLCYNFSAVAFDLREIANVDASHRFPL
jgi:hypothetical protein